MFDKKLAEVEASGLSDASTCGVVRTTRGISAADVADRHAVATWSFFVCILCSHSGMLMGLDDTTLPSIMYPQVPGDSQIIRYRHVDQRE
ncbi:hypothetical protein Pdw03_5276 [Penicillium digitatum]|uniref:Uncharacterized protein n=1 Tax=Penicillium digitatum TaxID=36651 RepID=A0A7T7BPT2_PENDI|nr:hypothetical protein Pdw03_5276 [Penicillium digitatum]